MLIYYLFFFILLFGILFSLSTRKKYDYLEKTIFLIIGIGLILFSGLRNNIGIDFFNYESIFNVIKLEPQNYYKSIEKGYFFLNRFSNSFQNVIFIMAIMGVGIKIYCINKYSDNRFITMFFYFTTTYLIYDMGIMRQGVAISFSLLSIEYILKRKVLKFLFTIFLGSLFHKSIFIFIPLYFLSNVIITRKRLYIIILFSILVYIIRIDETIVSVVMKMDIPIISSRLRDYYYTNSFREDITISLLKKIVFLLIFFNIYLKERIEDKKSNLFLKGYLLSIIFMCCFPTITIIGTRGSYYLYSLQMFIFATIIEKTKKISQKLLLVSIAILLCFTTLQSAIFNDKHPYIPYKNILIDD